MSGEVDQNLTAQHAMQQSICDMMQEICPLKGRTIGEIRKEVLRTREIMTLSTIDPDADPAIERPAEKVLRNSFGEDLFPGLGNLRFKNSDYRLQEDLDDIMIGELNWDSEENPMTDNEEKDFLEDYRILDCAVIPNRFDTKMEIVIYIDCTFDEALARCRRLYGEGNGPANAPLDMEFPDAED